MIEDRLARTLDRVAAAAPPEDGAFDRFLRHRARRSRRTAAATALVGLVALASAVALAPRGHGDAAPPRLDVSGQPGPEHWRGGPLVVSAPLEGFEVGVPAGWEATPTWKGIDLRPADPDLRRHLAGPVQLDTSFLAERDNPAPNAWKDDAYTAPETLPTLSPTPRGERSTGSFPLDRRWFRLERRDGPWRATQWHISWPYRCEPGVACPAKLAMRTLRVAFSADDGAWPQVAGLGERLLGTARPIANAVAGQRQAPRPDCVDGRTVVTERLLQTETYGPLGVRFGWRFRATAPLVPCTLRGRFAVEVVADGRRADVQGNADPVTPAVDFPESSDLRSGEAGTATVLLRWSNWCDGPAAVRWLDGVPADRRPQPPPLPAPPCRSTSRPSVLRRVG
jgi:hypothetical protein